MIKLYDPAISEEDRAFVYKAMCGGRGLTNLEDGYVRMFEESVEKYLGVKHAIAVSSGTAALHLAFNVIDGMDTICDFLLPGLSFPAVRNMAFHSGFEIHYSDICPKTYNMDISKTKDDCEFYDAIVPVHLYGQSADMDAIMKLEDKNSLLWVVEDAACALGAKYKDQFCGTIGDVGCFSFHPRKVITTGEGGMVVTNDHSIANHVRSLRNHGDIHIKTDDPFPMIGFNYRMSEMAGALGYSQMKRLDRTIERRRQIAAVYNSAFDIYGEGKVVTPIQAKDCFHIYQSYVVRIGGMSSSTIANTLYTAKIIKALRAKEIGCAIGSYCLDVSKLEALRAADQTIALPIHTKMSDDDAMTVAKTLLGVL